MKLISYIAAVTILFFTNCSPTSKSKEENKLVDTLPIGSIHHEPPFVDVKIYLPDTIIKFGDKIYINITLTNKSPKNQKVLFDKPKISTGGPWMTCGDVTDNKTHKSVVKYQNKAVLANQVLSEDQPNEMYYNLFPSQSISKKYELTDIVLLNTPHYELPRGNYTVQVFYYNNISNVCKLTIN